MGLINHLLGNATEVDIAKLEQEFSPILCEGEILESAYSLIRDKWVFTNKRLIMLDVQGLTGSKREYRSIPYFLYFCRRFFGERHFMNAV